MNPKTTPRIKLLIAIVLAFTIVKVGAPRVFLADSPNVSPEFIAFLQDPFGGDKPADSGEVPVVANIGVSEPPNEGTLQYTPLIQGVQAAEDPQTGKKYVKVEAGTQLQVHTVTLSDGRVVKVYTPAQ